MHDAMWPENLSSQVWGESRLQRHTPPPPGKASETCEFPNMIPNYPVLLFFLLNIVLGSEADGMKPGRHANSSLQKSMHSPSVGSLWEKKKKTGGKKNLPPTVESSEITALTDLGV